LRITRRIRPLLPLLPLLLLVPLASGQTSSTPDPNNPTPSEQAQPAQNTGAPAEQSSQENKSQPGATAAAPGKKQDDPKQKGGEGEESKGEQTKRMLYVVPNFAAVSSGRQLPALSPKAKFSLAFEDSFDYSSFVWTGILATQSYGLDSYPELGTGVAGYSRYYWRGFLDEVSGTYFTEAIVPALTREDPRYYTQEGGGFFHRLAYALSRTVVTKTDSGGTTFNWSEVGGNALEAALSNAYYPPQERGPGKTAENWATQMESAALNNIAKEFWPDFRRIVLRRQ
jgi:hypothetical protein